MEYDEEMATDQGFMTAFEKLRDDKESLSAILKQKVQEWKKEYSEPKE
eukprot:CAMPEP_0114590334 /NCGR_PEP_ID=MMETSP0125-20121206/12601_1 /TAXON_ID=485358 ORGANISM="Aristerostoma sp., Strain ATCC 50986" /NCGR_SAMPLE_ID=MMETSP0125 /ASSEMBLY_ACC=CAM_ASM_000245 /LENGTH=47 /DNA_ID= /DNA_START= /DNA_END= /DNA_ORIENTATION=